MAYGLPVVTRPVGGIKDFFEEGKMGSLAASVDPADIAEAVENILTNSELRRKIGKYNREYAARNFKASNVASRLLAIYDEVVNEKETH